MFTPGATTLLAILHLIHALFYGFGVEEYGRVWKSMGSQEEGSSVCTVHSEVLHCFQENSYTPHLYSPFCNVSDRFWSHLWEETVKIKSHMFWQKLSVLSAQHNLAFSSSRATLKTRTGKDPVSSRHHHLFQGTQTLINISGAWAYSWEPVSVIHVHSWKCLW